MQDLGETMQTTRLILAGTAALALSAAAMTAPAAASGFELWEQSTYGTGMAYAGIAAGGSLSTQFWNPATLGEVNGLIYETDLSGVLPNVDVTLDPSILSTPAQDQGNVLASSIIPATSIGYRVNQNIILGFELNAPFGLTSSYPDRSYAHNFLGGESVLGYSHIVTIEANPNIAYQFNDQLTVAAGLQAQYMELKETGFGETTGVYSGHTNDIGFGYTLGIDWKPLKGTTIGVGYRSGITNKIEGNLSGIYIPGPGFLPPLSGTLSVKTPAILSVGIAQELDDRWTLRAGAEFTNWSVLKSVPVTGDAAAVIYEFFGTPSIPFNYKDAWFASVGAEYKATKELTVRGGLGYETSPLSDATRDFRVPDADRIWVSAGLSYAPQKWYSFDVGYSYLHGLAKHIDAAAPYGGGPTLNGPFSATYTSDISIVSVAWKVKFGG